MNEADYRNYIAAFNGRDYDRLHEFFHDDVSLTTLGYEMKGKAAIRRFYEFFHDHVRETVSLRQFVGGGDSVFADVVIRFEGLKDLPAERLAAEGYGKMTPVPKGVAVEVQFFINYQLNEAGKIVRIRCGIYEPPSSD